MAQIKQKVRLLPHFFCLEISSNAVLLQVSEKRDAKELKLKANHNASFHLSCTMMDAKELKLKANHNKENNIAQTRTDAKELKLKANHNTDSIMVK